METSKGPDSMTDKMPKDVCAQAANDRLSGRETEKTQTDGEMEERSYPLTESNVIEVYKFLRNNETIPDEELIAVQNRFFELCNHQSKLI